MLHHLNNAIKEIFGQIPLTGTIKFCALSVAFTSTCILVSTGSCKIISKGILYGNQRFQKYKHVYITSYAYLLLM